MIRLHFIVEGQTEEEFVNALLRDHLVHHGVLCDARCVLTSRQGYRQFEGGISRYKQIRRDIRLWTMENSGRDARFTTMFDLYRLPADFPGLTDAAAIPDACRKIELIERRFAEDVNDMRFVPYLQLHEFEALLFSDIRCMQAEFPAAAKEIAPLQDSTGLFESLELIDDGSDTAPSKRIIAEMPAYGGLKVSAGPRVAASIGLPILRNRCLHFNSWFNHTRSLTPLTHLAGASQKAKVKAPSYRRSGAGARSQRSNPLRSGLANRRSVNCPIPSAALKPARA